MIRRVIGILTSTAVICGGAAVLESRAADEGNRYSAAEPVAATLPAPVEAAATKSAAADPPATKPPATKPPTKPPAQKPPAPGAPQVPEESATLRDDPIIVPDPKQSADNNVSFPNDI
jgi:hypothetical protein